MFIRTTVLSFESRAAATLKKKRRDGCAGGSKRVVTNPLVNIANSIEIVNNACERALSL